MQSDGMTTGEISRGLEAIREDIKDLSREVRTRPDWNDIRRVENGLIAQVQAERDARIAEVSALRAQKDAAHEVLRRSIADLEEWNTYAVRIVLSALGTGVVAWIVSAALPAL